MAQMKSTEIRSKFIDYFKCHDHQEVPSSSLIPHEDPTLLFANAGMNQFKKVFLGEETLPYSRATSSQKCIRAGGKHNDLENVGETARHHTFFEMLGNFSFGDYFKEEAIYFCWEFMTKEIGLPKDKLWATVYLDDDEAFNLWKKIAPELGDRILRFDEKENYWSMGDTGPCGPCAEIHIDRGEKFDYGGPPSTVNGEGDRFIELWNLVFMQFNRDALGKVTPLPKPSVDTGGGLERFACILQNGETNYETDLFMPIIQEIEELSRKKYEIGPGGLSHRVIADHIRALTFAFSDGAVPSNEKRGYVLRRILRRAARHGRLLDLRQPFLYKLAGSVVSNMSSAYPELKQNLEHVSGIIKAEEERFGETLDTGLELFEQVVEKVKSAGGARIPSEEAFKLYDTYGFPFDLTQVMAREREMTVDEAGFEKELARQKQQSKDDYKSKGITFGGRTFDLDIKTDFTGYDDNIRLETELVKVLPLDKNDLQVAILKQTPFYAESGGQIGDTGRILYNGNEFAVEDTKKEGDTVLHIGKNIKGDLESAVGKRVNAEVDITRQKSTQRNHTATHILHAALRHVLGEHVRQAGSLVAPDRLRFDFTHYKAVEEGELKQIEDFVNRVVLQNHPVKWQNTDFDSAKSAGAMALFGEKYGEEVRMVTIEDISCELCGGTHVQATGEIGPFVIISESAIAAGMRRIEAATGDFALSYLKRKKETVETAARLLKVPSEELVERLISLTESEKKLARELSNIKKKQEIESAKGKLKSSGDIVNGVVLITDKVFGRDAALTYTDQLKKADKPTIVGLLNNKNYFLAASPQAIEKGVDARKAINHVNEVFSGRGGGKPHFCQGGTKGDIDTESFKKALMDFIEENS
ncbi:MAG: alanine--tRNA ligase [candidate division Zixibacteria bacterium]|nr:alanine--tRNA ligase [candidate division Zixibacteria bacterium]